MFLGDTEEFRTRHCTAEDQVPSPVAEDQVTGTLKPSLLGKFPGRGVGGLVKLVTAFAWPSSVRCLRIRGRGEFPIVPST